MKPEQVKKEVLKIKDWEWWAERPFAAFILSTFVGGQSRAYMKRIGLDVEWPTTLFQNGCWYKSQIVWGKFAKSLVKFLHNDQLSFEVSKSCENYLKSGREKIKQLSVSKKPTLQKMQEFYEILTPVSSYIWVTHGLEHHYRALIEKIAPKYFKGDINKFIGDISFPVKHNAHYYFEKALRGKMDLQKIQEKYGWIKIRDGFSEPFTIQELSLERKKLRNNPVKKYARSAIPKPLLKLAKITQELVYQRTLRTDVLYELLFIGRPILKEVAKYYKVEFKDLRYYSALDLASGKLKRYSDKVTYISYGKDFAFINKSLFKEKVNSSQSIKGVIANQGFIKGIVKVVKVAHEISKVKKGDILFAPTTFPSFIMGMKKAAAFVTDEGGITSHAAIVSRELGKPCIIGTKIGTKVFKDGDLVEVDANKGIVRKIK